MHWQVLRIKESTKMAKGRNVRVEKVEGTELVRITSECICCGKVQSIQLNESVYVKWIRGEHIQDVAPELSVDDREFLISGVCGTCFDNMFADEEEDDME